MPPDIKIPVISPEGEPYLIPSSKLSEAKKAGWRLDTPEEAKSREEEKFYTSPVAQVSAGAKAVGRGLSFGLSDVASQALGEDQESIRKLEEYNPGITTAGEIAGSVGGLAATGLGGIAAKGAGKLFAAKGVETLGKTALMGATKTGAAGVAEGTAIAAGQLVSEAAIGEDDLTTDRIFGHLVSGATIGGLTGGLLGGITPLAKTATAKAKDVLSSQVVINASKFDDTMASTPGHHAIKSLKGTQGQMEKLARNKDRYKSVGEELLEPRPELGGASVIPKTGGIGKTARNIESMMDASGKAKSEAMDEIAKGADDLGLTIDGKAIAEKIRSENLKGMELRGKVIPHFERKHSAVKKIADKWDEFGEMSIKEAEDIKTKMQGDIKKLYKKMDTNEVDEALMDAARSMRESVETVAEQAANSMGRPDLLEKFLKNKKTYGAMAEALPMATKGAMSKAKRDAFSMKELMVGGATGASGFATGVPGLGPAMMLGGAVGKRLVADRGSAIRAHVMNRSNRLAAIKSAAMKSEQRADGVITRLVSTAKKYAEKPTKAGARAIEEIKDFVPVSVSTNIFGKLSFATAPAMAKEKDMPDYRKRVTELSELVANPDRMQEYTSKISGNLGDTSPAVALGVAQKAEAAVRHFHETAPKPSIYPDTMLPLDYSDTWEAPESDKKRWASRLEVGNDPIIALERASDGTLMPEAADTLRVLFPRAYADFMEKLAAKGPELKSLPTRKKAGLSILTGLPVDQTFRPEFVQSVQTAYLGEEGPQLAPPASPGAVRPTATGLNKLDISKREQTSSERLLSR